MENNEEQGFDTITTTRRLEDWFLEHVAFPAGPGVERWPGGRSDSIRVVLLAYWTAHVEWYCVKNDEPGRSCDLIELRALGVALALLEMFWHDVARIELAELEWLRKAGAITCVPQSMRTALVGLADQIAATPLLVRSRAEPPGVQDTFSLMLSPNNLGRLGSATARSRGSWARPRAPLTGAAVRKMPARSRIASGPLRSYSLDRAKRSKPHGIVRAWPQVQHNESMNKNTN